jgi:predicted tellurium resistance membrane protein TerC
MQDLFTVQNLFALLTLTALELVLGIDNVIFIAILSSKLPASEQDRARKLGIGIAVLSRVLLLLGITWVIGLTAPILTLFGNAISGRDLILLAGGAFLIAKSTIEIHDKLEVADTGAEKRIGPVTTLWSVIAQVVVIDIVFSLDSVITAVGISGVLPIMIVAIVVAAAIMVAFSGGIARFVEHHPTMKILALAFLILIGVLLVIEGWNPELVEHLHLKNYAYFAMAFSFLVETINIRVRKAGEPVRLHNRPTMPPEPGEQA